MSDVQFWNNSHAEWLILAALSGWDNVKVFQRLALPSLFKSKNMFRDLCLECGLWAFSENQSECSRSWSKKPRSLWKVADPQSPVQTTAGNKKEGGEQNGGDLAVCGKLQIFHFWKILPAIRVKHHQKRDLHLTYISHTFDNDLCWELSWENPDAVHQMTQCPTTADKKNEHGNMEIMK